MESPKVRYALTCNQNCIKVLFTHVYQFTFSATTPQSSVLYILSSLCLYSSDTSSLDYGCITYTISIHVHSVQYKKLGSHLRYLHSVWYCLWSRESYDTTSHSWKSTTCIYKNVHYERSDTHSELKRVALHKVSSDCF